MQPVAGATAGPLRRRPLEAGAMKMNHHQIIGSPPALSGSINRLLARSIIGRLQLALEDDISDDDQDDDDDDDDDDGNDDYYAYW